MKRGNPAVVGDSASNRLTLAVVVHRHRIRELVFLLAMQDLGRQREQLVECAARTGDAVLEQPLALHPAVVAALVHDVHFLDVVHPDVRREHRPVGKIPRQPVRVAEPVGEDLAEGVRIAVGRELVGGGKRVVAEPLGAARRRRAARIEPENRADERVEPLRLARVIGIGAAAVAEPEIAAARVEQAVIAVARLRGRIEFEVAVRVGQVGDHLADAKQLAPGAGERVRGRVGRVPFGDHVVIVHVRPCVSGRNEARRRRVAGRALAVHGIEQPVAGKFGMEDEADEPALEPVVDGEREHVGDVGIDRRMVVAVEQVEKPARIVDEPPAVGEVANEIDPRPAGGHDVLIRGPQLARVRQARDVTDLDHQPVFRDRSGLRRADDGHAGLRIK